MDKNTRILRLYNQLIQGHSVNKTIFCAETESLPRSFDRDIEDIRLFLSENFDSQELLYDRTLNQYTLGSVQPPPLDIAEFWFLFRLLLDSCVLRKDELEGIASNLHNNAMISPKTHAYAIGQLADYREPNHQKALLKLHSDLSECLREHLTIIIKVGKTLENSREYPVIPCLIQYELGSLYLKAFLKENPLSYHCYPLEHIYSFQILGSQTRAEIAQVTTYSMKQKTEAEDTFYG